MRHVEADLGIKSLDPSKASLEGRSKTLTQDIDILRWNFGGLKHFLVPSIVLMILRWKATRSISFRFDSAHPAGCSHHQKVAVFDDHLAVCGGIDVARATTRAPLRGPIFVS